MTTRAERWPARLLVVQAEGGRTLVAAGRIEAGVFVWRLPVLPPPR